MESKSVSPAVAVIVILIVIVVVLAVGWAIFFKPKTAPKDGKGPEGMMKPGMEGTAGMPGTMPGGEKTEEPAAVGEEKTEEPAAVGEEKTEEPAAVGEGKTEEPAPVGEKAEGGT